MKMWIFLIRSHDCLIGNRFKWRIVLNIWRFIPESRNCPVPNSGIVFSKRVFNGSAMKYSSRPAFNTVHHISMWSMVSIIYPIMTSSRILQEEMPDIHLYRTWWIWSACKRACLILWGCGRLLSVVFFCYDWIAKGGWQNGGALVPWAMSMYIYVYIYIYIYIHVGIYVCN